MKKVFFTILFSVIFMQITVLADVNTNMEENISYKETVKEVLYSTDSVFSNEETNARFFNDLELQKRAGYYYRDKEITEIVTQNVDVVTGNLSYIHTNGHTNSEFEIETQLFYNSLDRFEGMFGKNWHYNYEFYLFDFEEKVVVIFNDGHWEVFDALENGQYLSPKNSKKTLIKEDNKYILDFGNKKYYHFNEKGQLLKILNNNDKILAEFYYENINLSNEVSKELLTKITIKSNDIKFYYNENGYVEKAVDRPGREFYYEYEDGYITQITNAQGESYKYYYDDLNRLAKVENKENYTMLSVRYNREYRVGERISPSKVLTEYAYLENYTGLYQPELKGGGKFDLDEERRVVLINNSGFSSFGDTKVFDESDNIIQKTDKNGNSTYYEYDERNNLIKITNAYGIATQYTYTSSNDIESIIHPDNSIETFKYDENRNLIEYTNTLGYKTTLIYDEKGQLIKISKEQ